MPSDINGNNPIEVHQIRIFTDERGKFGSTLGVVVDEQRDLDDVRRLEITRQLGYSETVFINNLSLNDVSIFSQQGEVSFASPLLGVAWFIQNKIGKQLGHLVCKNTKLHILNKNGFIWLELYDPGILPPWQLEELSSADMIDNLKSEDISKDSHVLKWSWIDQESQPGIIRARTFAPAWEIPEEEANGSGSMKLTMNLNRSLIIKHGKGSVIRTLKNKNGVLVGGLVCYDKSFYI
jgi:predicted PhzF superfamily epimerase YddE/YHI9